MRVVVTAQQPRLDSLVDARFGRAACFVVVDTDTMEHRVVENNLNAPGGAGIGAGKTVIDTGAKVLLTGNCGPNAFRTLRAGGVEIYTGLTGTVRQAVEQYKVGRLTPAVDPSVQTHAGTGPQS